jgi:hypothetical protein
MRLRASSTNKEYKEKVRAKKKLITVLKVKKYLYKEILYNILGPNRIGDVHP